MRDHLFTVFKIERETKSAPYLIEQAGLKQHPSQSKPIS